MGKGHRDNHAARKKIGSEAFKKKAKRRVGSYVGPWNVTFECGRTDYQPLAHSNEVAEVVTKAHICSHQDCKPTSFERLAGWSKRS